MSVCGLLGTGFGVEDSTLQVGTLVLPATSNVRFPILYGADETEFQGTFICPPGPPGGGGSGGGPRDTTITLDVNAPGFVPGIANQGISIWILFGVIQSYLVMISGLNIRRVRMWFGPTRPAIEGSDIFIWFRPKLESPSKSLGPGRWGNRSDVQIEIHLLTRNMSDGAQIDERRSRAFYDLYWKLEQAFQGKNLFNKYTTFVPPLQGIWRPPDPASGAGPLTVEPMYLEDLPVPDKTQKEEGTLEAGFVVILPIVLALTVP